MNSGVHTEMKCTVIHAGVSAQIDRGETALALAVFI